MFKENMIMLSNEFSGVISKVFSTIGFVKETRDLLYGHLGYTDLNVRTEAPPTCCSELLFRRSRQWEVPQGIGKRDDLLA